MDAWVLINARWYKVTGKKVSESISRVIADMIEKHAAELEGESKTVRGTSRI